MLVHLALPPGSAYMKLGSGLERCTSGKLSLPLAVQRARRHSVPRHDRRDGRRTDTDADFCTFQGHFAGILTGIIRRMTVQLTGDILFAGLSQLLHSQFRDPRRAGRIGAGCRQSSAWFSDWLQHRHDFRVMACCCQQVDVGAWVLA